MIIKLTHQQKVLLLQAIQSGELDTSALPSDIDYIKSLSDEDLARELTRHYKFEDKDYILAEAELLSRYGKGEIGNIQFEEEMIAHLMQR